MLFKSLSLFFSNCKKASKFRNIIKDKSDITKLGGDFHLYIHM